MCFDFFSCASLLKATVILRFKVIFSLISKVSFSLMLVAAQVVIVCSTSKDFFINAIFGEEEHIIGILRFFEHDEPLFRT